MKITNEVTFRSVVLCVIAAVMAVCAMIYVGNI